MVHFACFLFSHFCCRLPTLSFLYSVTDTSVNALMTEESQTSAIHTERRRSVLSEIETRTAASSFSNKSDNGSLTELPRCKSTRSFNFDLILWKEIIMHFEYFCGEIHLLYI